VQHIAYFSSNIFQTLEMMRSASAWGGFEFLPGQVSSIMGALCSNPCSS
jgi:4-hydroxyphenylpyruvate dioxygenase-like putative hemolysin